MKKDTCKALISWLRVKLYHFHPCKRLLYQLFIGKTLTKVHKSCVYVCGSWYFFSILVKNVSIFHTGHPLFTDSWPHVHCDCALTLFWPQKSPRGSFYIWSPDLPRAVSAKTGEKGQLCPESQISAHLPRPFFWAEWNPTCQTFLPTLILSFHEFTDFSSHLASG